MLTFVVHVLIALFILAVLALPIFPIGFVFYLYRVYRINQVKKYDQELYLTAGTITHESKGRYNLSVYRHQMVFSHYSFVTDANPYGRVAALNGRKTSLSSYRPFPTGKYRLFVNCSG
ncbi:hypothetical protein [Streptococcus dentiloxodontae]